MSQFKTVSIIIVLFIASIQIVHSQHNSLDTGILLSPVYYDSEVITTKPFGNFCNFF